MSKLDEDLTERFVKAERQLPVDPQLFSGLLRKRVRRERMKRASTVGLVLVIALAGTMAYALAERGATLQPASTTISHAVPSLAAVGASIPGVPFPACHATSVTYYSERSQYGSIYLFARGSMGAACPELDSRNAYLGLNVGNLGPGPKPQIFGPIDCFKGCRVFGAPEIEGYGHVALAIVVVDGTGADSIELYRIHPSADPPFTQMTTVIQGRRVPLVFDWGNTGNYRAGANCVTVGKPTTGLGDELDLWHAELRGDTWHLVQRFMALDGDQVHLDHVERSSAAGADGFLPDGGGTNFCGASVTP
jgi:hypothetical protein